MVSMAKSSMEGPRPIPRRVITHQFVNSDIMNVLLKINDERYRRPNFAIWSASYASAKTLESEENISSSHLYGQLLLKQFLPYPPSR